MAVLDDARGPALPRCLPAEVHVVHGEEDHGRAGEELVVDGVDRAQGVVVGTEHGVVGAVGREAGADHVAPGVGGRVADRVVAGVHVLDVHGDAAGAQDAEDTPALEQHGGVVLAVGLDQKDAFVGSRSRELEGGLLDLGALVQRLALRRDEANQADDRQGEGQSTSDTVPHAGRCPALTLLVPLAQQLRHQRTPLEWR